ncbi:MAG: M28 family peptidase [Clostridia bacterium]|nr:M28 family peptidase [Clostridia bacterium]
MHNMIRELCALSGISGQESSVREYIVEHLKNAPAVSDIRTDSLGNCIVTLKGENPAPHRVVFAAHMDEVGGIVTGITDDGYLRFDVVGGINKDALFGKTVYVNGHIGVIGGKAVHLCSGDEKNTVPARSSMRIDIGADSEAEARNVACEGDAVTFSTECFALDDQSVCAKALDDRIGCALLLQLARTVPKCDITFVFTVQEEIGTRGATTAAFALQPEISVVIDSTTASDLLGVAKENHVTTFGCGPVVSFMDRGTLYDHDLYREIRQIATEHDIPTQTKTTVAGGNDSRAFQLTGVGSRVAAVSMPCRYIHSPASVYSQKDAEHTLHLLKILRDHLPSWEFSV